MTATQRFIVRFFAFAVLGAGLVAAGRGESHLALFLFLLSIVAFFILRAVLPSDEGPTK